MLGAKHELESSVLRVSASLRFSVLSRSTSSKLGRDSKWPWQSPSLGQGGSEALSPQKGRDVISLKLDVICHLKIHLHIYDMLMATLAGTVLFTGNFTTVYHTQNTPHVSQVLTVLKASTSYCTRRFTLLPSLLPGPGGQRPHGDPNVHIPK